MTEPIVGARYLFLDHEGKPDYLTVTDVTDNMVWYKFESDFFHKPIARTLWDSENYPTAEMVAAAMNSLPATDTIDILLKQAIESLQTSENKETK